jgi:hypothetical protein
MTNKTIHWARILLGGPLAEVALILAIVPLGLRFGDNFLHYTAPPGSSRSPMRSLSLQPDDLLTIPWMALSIDFMRLVSSTHAILATGL